MKFKIEHAKTRTKTDDETLANVAQGRRRLEPHQFGRVSSDNLFIRGLSFIGHAWLLFSAPAAMPVASAGRLPISFRGAGRAGALSGAMNDSLWAAAPIAPVASLGTRHLSVKDALGNSSDACPTWTEGSQVPELPEHVSKGKTLAIKLSLQSMSTTDGLTRFCYKTDAGDSSPLLRVKPGDTLDIDLSNDVTPANNTVPVKPHSRRVTCNNMSHVQDASTNLHFHGMTVSPACPQDDVLSIVINRGEIFQYKVKIPADAESGLFWLHPHIHGSTEQQVQGGATIPLIVEGIENLQPQVADLPEKVLMVRDTRRNTTGDDAAAPAWDLSVNGVPVSYVQGNTSDYTPAVVPARPGKMFMRVVNAAADAILDLALVTNDAPQTLNLVALDGYVLRTEVNGTVQPLLRQVDHVLVPPSGRAEFIICLPAGAHNVTQLVTRYVNTGPDGDNDPARPLVTFDIDPNAPQGRTMPAVKQLQRLAPAIESSSPVRTRTLYFSEDDASSAFYITEVGDTPRVFSADEPPAIVVEQGAVEDWIIENRSRESHEFHIHQLHFVLMEQNNQPVQPAERQALDTVNVGYWNGKGPYPSVKVRMDFRGADVGQFVYHCHILEHEDGGMMRAIQVNVVGSKR